MTPSLFGHGEQQLLIFLNHLNAQKSTIKFTMEQEINGQLPFLDVLVKRNSRHLHTSIYRKPTHMDCYIHFKLNHHPATKLGTILTLKRRQMKYAKVRILKRNYTIFSVPSLPMDTPMDSSKIPYPRGEKSDSQI